MLQRLLVVVLRPAHNVMVHGVQSRVTAQFRRVAGATPVQLVVDLFLLHVQITVVGFQLDFALLALNETELRIDAVDGRGFAVDVLVFGII